MLDPLQARILEAVKPHKASHLCGDPTPSVAMYARLDPQ
jgi:hypothetical protein